MESIEVKILEKKPEFVRVQLPFIDVPVDMSHSFMQKRIDSGYFQVVQETSI